MSYAREDGDGNFELAEMPSITKKDGGKLPYAVFLRWKDTKKAEHGYFPVVHNRPSMPVTGEPEPAEPVFDADKWTIDYTVDGNPWLQAIDQAALVAQIGERIRQIAEAKIEAFSTETQMRQLLSEASVLNKHRANTPTDEQLTAIEARLLELETVQAWIAIQIPESAKEVGQAVGAGSLTLDDAEASPLWPDPPAVSLELAEISTELAKSVAGIA